jgi:hypothetical protein
VRGVWRCSQAATEMNERSSRSHSIFTIRLRQRDTENKGHNLFAKVCTNLASRCLYPTRRGAENCRDRSGEVQSFARRRSTLWISRDRSARQRLARRAIGSRRDPTSTRA